jgi:hypothetical protein
VRKWWAWKVYPVASSRRTMHSSSSGGRGVKAALRHKLSGLSQKGYGGKGRSSHCVRHKISRTLTGTPQTIGFPGWGVHCVKYLYTITRQAAYMHVCHMCTQMLDFRLCSMLGIVHTPCSHLQWSQAFPSVRPEARRCTVWRSCSPQYMPPGPLV